MAGLFRARIPVVEQLTDAECGAACLAMVLGFFGRSMRLDDVREAIASDRGGASARAILDAARAFGLDAAGGSIELEALARAPRGAILHYGFDHFVVFDGMAGDAFRIVDPASGRRTLSREEMSRAFTGIALFFTPGPRFQRSPAPPSPLLRYARSLMRHGAHWRRIVATSLLLQVFSLAMPFMMGVLVDRVLPAHDASLLGGLLLGLSALVLFDFAASTVRGYMLLDLRTRLDADMTRAFLEHVVDLPLPFFQRRSAGDLIMRLNSNATLREVLTSGALSALLDGSLVILYLAIFVVVSPRMASVVVLVGALHVAVYLITRRARRERMAEIQSAQARADGYQVELFAAIGTLKSMGAERQALERWQRLHTRSLNASFRSGALTALTDAATGALRMGGPLLVLGVGGWLVMAGRISLGTMLSLEALAVGVLTPLASMVETARQLEVAYGFVTRLDDVLLAPVEEGLDPSRATHALRGGIECEDLVYRYEALSAPAIDRVSLSIRPGQFVAIVGRSGSGKSTLASLLLGLYTPSEGTVRFDAVPLGAMDLRAVRGQIGVVPQSLEIFSGSIRSNLLLGRPDASGDEIVRAAALAQVHDEIAAMPMGYDTPVGEGGSALSGGQRQRLALARALLRRPSIVLLDEATSALDAITESAVQEALESLDCTRIVIAHRLSSVVRADRIFVLRDGAVVEEGRHEELLARGGEYADLVASQLQRGSHAPADHAAGGVHARAS